jgi:hypothetical protein
MKPCALEHPLNHAFCHVVDVDGHGLQVLAGVSNLSEWL